MADPIQANAGPSNGFDFRNLTNLLAGSTLSWAKGALDKSLGLAAPNNPAPAAAIATPQAPAPAGNSTMKWVMIGGGALLAVILLMRLTK